MLQMDEIRALCTDETTVLTEHLLLRMRERGIRYGDIISALATGDIIEQYETDYPFPSCLVLGNSLHVVCSIGVGMLYIITAYYPSPEKWEADGRTRKEQTR